MSNNAPTTKSRQKKRALPAPRPCSGGGRQRQGRRRRAPRCRPPVGGGTKRSVEVPSPSGSAPSAVPSKSADRPSPFGAPSARPWAREPRARQEPPARSIDRCHDWPRSPAEWNAILSPSIVSLPHFPPSHFSPYLSFSRLNYVTIMILSSGSFFSLLSLSSGILFFFFFFQLL